MSRASRQHDEHVWQEIVMSVSFDDDMHADLARMAMGMDPIYADRHQDRWTKWNTACLLIVLAVIMMAVAIGVSS